MVGTPERAPYTESGDKEAAGAEAGECTDAAELYYLSAPGKIGGRDVYRITALGGECQ